MLVRLNATQQAFRGRLLRRCRLSDLQIPRPQAKQFTFSYGCDWLIPTCNAKFLISLHAAGEPLC